MLLFLAPERPQVESPQRTVAVVENDASVRRSVVRLLNANGFATEAFASAEAFLSHADASQFGCIVLDIHLGGISGIELWHRLKASGSELPVIFITAVEDEALHVEAVKAGCIAYLRKPFPAALLINAVDRALGL
ncbi:response regulator [Ensifer sp. T173]|uniref:Response regulator n=1 Tax=Ensifer canadensis TaxID=555315 RepID=A0AAW4FDY2_9HYPH|nr:MULTISPECIES: response regulator [Ensifer]KQW67280.1 two-component system response regulator [Ensifer sp. Root127]KQY63197.1 two-component system response regulator [Ensifer sp. Root142]MBD9487956.1 response regulator [Ensifer sp. ENS11]MBM3090360.1 response regulator [Ensifer canadensis]UBI80961.1 response regulator [Ensifer canadensis]